MYRIVSDFELVFMELEEILNFFLRNIVNSMIVGFTFELTVKNKSTFFGKSDDSCFDWTILASIGHESVQPQLIHSSQQLSTLSSDQHASAPFYQARKLTSCACHKISVGICSSNRCSCFKNGLKCHAGCHGSRRVYCKNPCK